MNVIKLARLPLQTLSREGKLCGQLAGDELPNAVDIITNTYGAKASSYHVWSSTVHYIREHSKIYCIIMEKCLKFNRDKNY